MNTGVPWRLLLCAVVVSGLAGCRSTRLVRVDLLPFGSQADMVSKPGEYPGYTLAAGCGHALGRRNMSVVGPASKPPADSASIKRLKDEIVYPSVRDIDPAVGVGYGRGCGQGAIVVTLSSWKTVDKALARLGLLVASLSSRIDIEVRVVPSGNR